MANRLLVHDYVNYRLEKVGLHWPGRNRSLGTAATAAPSNKARQTMRLLGDEFESRYTEVFREMCDQLHITPQTAQSTFATIVDELFADGVRWGRVVALVAFGGSLAARCVDKEMPDLVDSVAVWVTAYMDNNLQSWIDLNDGWVGTRAVSYRHSWAHTFWPPLCVAFVVTVIHIGLHVEVMECGRWWVRNPDPGAIVGWVFSLTRQLTVFVSSEHVGHTFLAKFRIRPLFSWGSAPSIYEVGGHVKKPCHFGHYYCCLVSCCPTCYLASPV